MDLISRSNVRAKAQNLKILSYNLRLGMRGERPDLINAIMEPIQQIRYDIIGLSETHSPTNFHGNWQNGDEIHIGAGEQRPNVQPVGGVGFIVAERLRRNIIGVEIHSPRIATLKLRVPKQRKPLLIVQVYAPHSGYDDNDIERFYEEVERVLDQPAYRKVVMGDWNAKVGKREPGERSIGVHSSDTRNDSGERLVAFSEYNKLHIMNTFFDKPAAKRWTWVSPDGNNRHEIDYFLCDSRRFISNVEVISKFNTGSDHRMIRATLAMNPYLDKLRQHQSRQSQSKQNPVSPAALQIQILNDKDYSLGDGDSSAKCERFTNSLNAFVDKSRLPKTTTTQSSRISPQTRELMAKRLELQHEGGAEYREISKLIRTRLYVDYANYKDHRLVQSVEAGRGLKKPRRELCQVRKMMVALKTGDGGRATTRPEMEEECRRFYTDLFESKVRVEAVKDEREEEEVPIILATEVEHALNSISKGKAPGPDGITNDTLKAGGEPLWRRVADLFNDILNTEQIPQQWRESRTVLLHKKGDTEELKNYRPISLLSALYKLFTKVLLNRITPTLDEAQPREQAGFRRGYSTTDHLQTLRQVIERSREFQRPLAVVFVDYEKAFDTVEYNAVHNALIRQNVQPKYVRLLDNINTGCSTQITLFQRPIEIPIERGVRQGDTISPKLFTAALEEVFRTLQWNEYGIPIDGERLTNLRFADDIILCGQSAQEVNRLLNQLNAASTTIGLKMNKKKTEWMQNEESRKDSIITKVLIQHEPIAEVEKYIYLGQEVTLSHDQRIEGEIGRRIRAGWFAFSQTKEVIQQLRDNSHRQHLFNSTVLPAMTYGSEVWPRRDRDAKRLRVAQRAMERRILKVSMLDRIPNTEIRRRTGFKDVYAEATRQKMRWAGHVARLQDNRWTYRTTFWYPPRNANNYSRPHGGIPARWRDRIHSYNTNATGQGWWHRTAQDRSRWRGVVRSAELEELQDPNRR